MCAISIKKLEACSNLLKQLGKRSILETKPNPGNINIESLRLTPLKRDVAEFSRKNLGTLPRIIDRTTGKTVPTELGIIERDNKMYFNLKTKNSENLGYATLEYPQRGLFKIPMGDDYIYNSMELTTLETINKGNGLSPYKGIGTELIKSAIKESKKRGFNGRIHLMAYDAKPPTPFYYKCGLRFVDENKNKLMENFLKTKGAQLDEKIQQGLMYLPDENIEKLLSS